MRWEGLFADLEARMTAAERDALAAEVAERAVAERATVELAARVLACRGRRLALRVRGGRVVAGTLVDGAATWFLVADAGVETVVPAAAVAAVEGLEGPAVVLGEVDRRLRIGTALRELARARAEVRVDVGDSAYDGVIVAVGADHLDLVPDEGARVAIALSAVLTVASRGQSS